MESDPVCLVFYERPPVSRGLLCGFAGGSRACPAGPPWEDLGAVEGKSLGSRRVLDWVCVQEVTGGYSHSNPSVPKAMYRKAFGVGFKMHDKMAPDTERHPLTEWPAWTLEDI